MTGEDPKIALRPTTHHDVEFAWHLYRGLMKPLTEELLEWDDALQRRFIERDLASGDASIITIEGQAAGWIQVRETEHRISILQLYLLPKFQSRRAGTSIIHELIARARQTDRHLVLEVMKNNRARRLYERLGFVVTGQSAHKLNMAWRGEGQA
jgi:ribosomal protein S18 acetylase RimI-like enzyme